MPSNICVDCAKKKWHSSRFIVLQAALLCGIVLLSSPTCPALPEGLCLCSGPWRRDVGLRVNAPRPLCVGVPPRQPPAAHPPAAPARDGPGRLHAGAGARHAALLPRVPHAAHAGRVARAAPRRRAGPRAALQEGLARADREGAREAAPAVWECGRAALLLAPSFSCCGLTSPSFQADIPQTKASLMTIQVVEEVHLHAPLA